MADPNPAPARWTILERAALTAALLAIAAIIAGAAGAPVLDVLFDAGAQPVRTVWTLIADTLTAAAHSLIGA